MNLRFYKLCIIGIQVVKTMLLVSININIMINNELINELNELNEFNELKELKELNELN
jgi:hypothetical protein